MSLTTLFLHLPRSWRKRRPPQPRVSRSDRVGHGFIDGTFSRIAASSVYKREGVAIPDFGRGRCPPRSYCRTLLGKVLSNLRPDLTIRHLVNCFNTYDASTEVIFFKTFFQFILCLTRTKYQNSLCITNRRNDRIIINVEMSRKSSLAAIIRGYLL